MSEIVWQPPQFAVDKPPKLHYSIKLPHDTSYPQNFARSARLCPDGSTALIHCENQTLHFLDLKVSINDGRIHMLILIQAKRAPSFRLPLRQAAPILDVAWYPHATMISPPTFCFAASVRDCPVKLLDANSGILRASYRIVDHRERFIAPHCMAFSRTGEKLYCGFESAVEVFDISRPGDDGTRIRTTPGRKSKDGMKGIVSALAISPDNAYFAAGNFTPAATIPILLFDASSESPDPIMSLGSDLNLGGISQICFDAWRPHILYASFRIDARVYAWDLRAGVGSGIPFRVYGPPPPPGEDRTNQRIRFDIDAGGKWLATGSRDGSISLFDLHGDSGNEADTDHQSEEMEEVLPTLEFKAHGDAIGSVGFHVLEPMLLSLSGSRHFSDLNESDSSEGETSDEINESVGTKQASVQTGPTVRDASVKLWSFSQ